MWLLLDIRCAVIYKYVWQTCQQSLLIISIEQYFVRGNYTFSELCSSRNIYTPTPHPPLPPPPHHGGQKFQGEGGPKGGNFRGVGGLPLLTEVFLTRYPSPATRHPLPATRHPPPVTRHPPPATRHPRKSPADFFIGFRRVLMF